jgi:hypothetical protein
LIGCKNERIGVSMQKTIDYWLEEAEEALKVADHLFEKKGLFIFAILWSSGCGKNYQSYLYPKKK